MTSELDSPEEIRDAGILERAHAIYTEKLAEIREIERNFCDAALSESRKHKPTAQAQGDESE